MSGLLGPALLLVLAQEPVDIQVRTEGIREDGVLVGAREGMNAGGPVSREGIDRASVWFEIGRGIDVSDSVRVVLGASTKSRDEGERLAVGRPDGTRGLFSRLELQVREAYVEFRDLFLEGGRLRVGVQPLRYSLRPHGEATFLDLLESESAFAGLAGGHFRNRAFPDQLTPAGVLYRLDPHEGWRLDVFGFRFVPDPKPLEESEAVFGAYFDAIPDPERLKVFGVLALFRSGVGGSRVGTLGLGVDAYLDHEKLFEVFFEGYLQRGNLRSGVEKRAHALHGGVRLVGLLPGAAASLEVRAFLASGDRSAADGEDEAFQSYESMNRLAILQSDGWGLDIDTNVRLLMLAAMVKGLRAGEGTISLRADAGLGRLDHAPLGPGGMRYTDERDLGFEMDLELRWRGRSGLQVFARAAWLFESDFVGALTGSDTTHLAALGAALSW